MQDTTLNINSKTIKQILFFCVLIISLIIAFNQIDKHRKYLQFVELNDYITNSKMFSEIKNLITDSIVYKDQNQHNIPIDKIYEIAKEDKYIWTAVKINNAYFFAQKNNRD